MEKIFKFGKVAVNGTRKLNEIEVEIALTGTNADNYVFSASGKIWNATKTKTLSLDAGGQCLDRILPLLPNNETFKTIHRLWKQYHLNDLHAGTEKQEEALKQHFGDGYKVYEESCSYLKSINLYDDDGYIYGTKWLYRRIPDEDIRIIKSLFRN